MRIAIVKLSALGDIIHAMVALQFIKKHLPDALIDWIVEENVREILVHNPDIHQIHSVNIKQAKQQKSFKLLFKTLNNLRKLPKYDVVIDAQGLLKSAIVARIIPSKVVFGFDKNSLRESLAAKFYSKTCQMDYAKNIIERNLWVISSALGFSISAQDILNKRPFLNYAHQKSDNFITTDKPNIALIVGASFDSKIYPEEKYAKIANELDANITLLWGNEKEKIRAENIQNLAPKTLISERLTLDELKQFIAKMDLVIGGDTGPTHIAWALNIASITLFGSTPAHRNAYKTDVNLVLKSASEVNVYKINKSDFSIKTIAANDVVSKARKLLSLPQKSNQ